VMICASLALILTSNWNGRCDVPLPRLWHCQLQYYQLLIRVGPYRLPRVCARSISPSLALDTPIYFLSLAGFGRVARPAQPFLLLLRDANEVAFFTYCWHANMLYHVMETGRSTFF